MVSALASSEEESSRDRKENIKYPKDQRQELGSERKRKEAKKHIFDGARPRGAMLSA